MVWGALNDLKTLKSQEEHISFTAPQAGSCLPLFSVRFKVQVLRSHSTQMRIKSERRVFERTHAGGAAPLCGQKSLAMIIPSASFVPAAA